MDKMEELKEMQKIALDTGDFVSLSAINEQIYLLREELRKEKKKAKQEQREKTLHDRIEQILTK